MEEMPTAHEHAHPLHGHVGYWLRKVADDLERAFAVRSKAHGVTPIEWLTLCALDASGALTPGEVGRSLGTGSGATSKILGRLEDRGLVERYVTDLGVDTREHVMALTDAGEDLVPQLAALWSENERSFFGHLDAKDRAALVEALRAVLTRRDVEPAPG